MISKRRVVKDIPKLYLIISNLELGYFIFIYKQVNIMDSDMPFTTLIEQQEELRNPFLPDNTQLCSDLSQSHASQLIAQFVT